jgi:hypothetical protein
MGNLDSKLSGSVATMDMPKIGDKVEYKNHNGFHYLCFVLEVHADQSIDLVYWDRRFGEWLNAEKIPYVGNANYNEYFWRFPTE